MQKLTRRHDLLMYACALLAFLVVAAGGIGPLMTGVFLGGWAISWVAGRRGWTQGISERIWNGIILATVALTGAQMYLTEDSIIDIGIRFILLLLLLKLFSRRGGERDDWQIYALTFLLMAAGTAVNEDLTYGIVFGLYVPLTTFGLAMLHLRTETARARRMRREQFSRVYGVALVVLAGAVFLSSVTIFFVFPRVGLGFFAKKSRAGASVTGFSEQVELGSHGLIRNNPEVVLRVEFDQEERMPAEAVGYHWRMMSFDVYDGRSWERSQTERRVNLDMNREERSFELAKLRTEATNELLESEPTRSLRIYMEPLNTEKMPRIWPTRDVVLPRSIPLPFNPDRAWLYGVPNYGDVYLRQRNELGIIFDLNVYDEPPREVMRPARFPTNPDKPTQNQIDALAPYLQLPPGQERLRQLSARVSAGAQTPYAKAEAIQAHLQSGQYTYTTDLPPMEGDDPIASFLFSSQRGHCEYFATAMALMLRAEGVHTRMVNGFLGGAWNNTGGYMAVRQGDAHAWVEVYIPTYGWVPFDPTPSSGTQPMQDGGLGGWMRDTYDAARMRWMQWVIEYDLDTQLEGARQLGRMLSPRGAGSSSEEREDEPEEPEGQIPVREIVLWSGLLGLCGLSWRAGRRRLGRRVLGVELPPLALGAAGVALWTGAGAGWGGWFWGTELAPMAGGAAGPAMTGLVAITLGRRLGWGRGREQLASSLFAELEHSARRADLARGTDEGPAHFLDRLAGHLPEAAAHLERFGQRYLAARFGGRALGPTQERELRQDLEHIKRALRERG